MNFHTISLTIAILARLSSAERMTVRGRILSDENFPLDYESSLSMKTAAIMVGGKSSKSKSAKAGKGGKAEKSGKAGLGFDPIQWTVPDVMLKHIDNGYLGDYEATNADADVAEFNEQYTRKGAAFVFDLGSFSSLTRRLGSTIVLAEIRTIWYHLAPIVAENNGVIMKSVGDSLHLYYEKVSDGLQAGQAMYLAVVARWRNKVALACDGDSKQGWCTNATEKDERKRFFNTAAMGGAFGDIILIVPGKQGAVVEAYGAPFNNAYYAGEEQAEHGQTIIDEGALQSLLDEAGQGTGDYCVERGTVPWTAGDFGINRFIVIKFVFGCYYTVCFDAECKIPDDE